LRQGKALGLVMALSGTAGLRVLGSEHYISSGYIPLTLSRRQRPCSMGVVDGIGVDQVVDSIKRARPTNNFFTKSIQVFAGQYISVSAYSARSTFDSTECSTTLDLFDSRCTVCEGSG